MNNNFRLLLTAGLLVPGVALAQINVGDTLGSTEEAIRSGLEAQGYTVTEIEIEDDEIEATVEMDGAEYEIEVSAETGLVTEIEAEDD